MYFVKIYLDNFSLNKIKVAKFPLLWENQNSEYSFIYSTFKVEEIKVPSEFKISY